jgi:hypothetical protein
MKKALQDELHEEMQKDERSFFNLPSRIRHYLLEWKNDNLEEYCRKYGELKLIQMTDAQLRVLFHYATEKDIKTQF